MTARKAETNRANAALSTGPKTDEGKMAVAINGVTHGLRSAKPVLPSLGESVEGWERHLDSIVADLAPEGALEAALADRVALGFWRLGRFDRVEQGVLAASIENTRLAATRNALMERRLCKYNEPTEEAVERLNRHRDCLQEIACLWDKLEEGADKEDVEPLVADDLITDCLPDDVWDVLADVYEAEFPDHPTTLGGLRNILKWLAKQTGSDERALCRAGAAKAARAAEEASKTVARIGRLADLAADLAIIDGDALAKLSRYETAIHRALQRDLHELQRLQARRVGEAVLAPVAVDVTTEG